MKPAPPWVCPVCREPLEPDGGTLGCSNGHRFDLARQGYVNLLIAGQRRSRQPGDSAEMVAARQRFLGTGAYDRIDDVVGHVVARTLVATDGPATVLDVGCGEGHHTRLIARNVARSWLADLPPHLAFAGVDVAKTAVARAAAADPDGWYAVASAADLPLATASVDVALLVFGPAVPVELARVVRPGGLVVAVHPGPQHLSSLRALVYEDARPHAIKGPLRTDVEWFARVGGVTATFPISIADSSTLGDLFTMTPYRWHAPPDVAARLEAAAAAGFTTTVDVVVTSYVRRTG